MILLVKGDDLVNDSINTIIGIYDDYLKNLIEHYNCSNIQELFLLQLSRGRVKHSNMQIRYNLRLRLVAIEVDVKDYITFSDYARNQLEEITKTQLIHLFGSGD